MHAGSHSFFWKRVSGKTKKCFQTQVTLRTEIKFMASISAAARDALVAIHIGMFNAAPGAARLSSMVLDYENGKTLKQIAAGFSTDANFRSQYPGFLTASEFADRMVANLLGDNADATTKTWSKNYVIGRLNAGVPDTEVFVLAVNALRAATNPDFAASQAQIENKLEVAKYYAIDLEQNSTDYSVLRSIIANVDENQSSVDTAVQTIGNDAQSFSLAAGATSVNEGGTVSFTLSTVKVPAGTSIAYTVSGVNAADVDGALTGTAVVDSNGKATISVKLLNDVSTEGAETVTVALDNGRATASATVNDTSLSPVYTVTAGAATANEGSTITFAVAADTAVNGTAAVTITGITAADVESLPTSVNIVNGKGTVTLVLKNDSATEGTETVSVKVGSSTATTTVADTSVTPILGTDSASGTVVSGQGTAIITPATILANDFGADGKAIASGTAITIVAGSATKGEVFTTKDGNFLFVASAGERTGSFKYTVAGQTGEGTVNVTLNTAPSVTVAALTVNEDETVAGTVTATDADSDTLTYTYSAKNGTVTDNGDGKFSYKGNANFNGTDTVTVVVNDGFTSVTKDVTVTVAAVDDAPELVTPAPATVTVNTGSTVTVDLSKYAKDVDSASLTYTAAAGTTTNGGTISITGSTATITYAQGGGSSVVGADSFKVSATDGTTTLSNIAVNLSVVNTAPSANNFSLSAKTGVTQTVDLTGQASDAEGNTLTPTVVLGSLSNGGSAEVKDGKIVYTSTIGYTGTETLKYTVTDGFGGTSSQGTITFTVSANTGGTSGDDLLYGSSSAEAIDGLAGNDTINGGGGADTITGGDGNDTVTYNDNAKQILGGAGIDTLVVNSDAISAKFDLNSTTDQVTDGSNTTIVVRGFENMDATKASNDITIDHINAETASLILGNGNDTITSLEKGTISGTLSVNTNGGNDTITVGDTKVKFSIEGGAGNDTFNLADLTAANASTSSSVYGGDGNDTFNLDNEVRVSVYGGAGNDTINANATNINDYVEGGDGDDIYIVTATNLTNADTIKGGAGTDTISTNGQAAALDLTGKDQNVTGIDKVIVNAGQTLTIDNAFMTQSDANTVEVSAGTGASALTLSAAIGSGYTIRIGTTGNVTLADGVNARVTVKDGVNGSVTGGTGNDSITGGTGNDTLAGGAGNDVILGGAGADQITLGAGTDSAEGGDGNDTFIANTTDVTNADTIKGNAGTDTLSFDGEDADINVTGLDQNITGIDKVVVNDGNVLTVDNSFVAQSDANTVEVSAGDGTKAMGLAAAVGSGYTVSIATTGTVTLQAGANRVSIKDGVAGAVTDSSGNDSITGGTGNDSITLTNGGTNVVLGGAGNDTITFAGTQANDSVEGGDGNDTIVTTAALLTNGDTIKGGAGTDTISTNADGANLDLTSKDQNTTGIDRVVVNESRTLTVDNSFVAQSDSNVIEVLAGDGTKAMTLSAAVGAAYTVRVATTGQVTLSDGVNSRVSVKDATNGSITGGTGNDTISGGTGNDTLSGGNGNDVITGGAGADQITLGGTGADSVDGGAGNDSIIGGTNLTNEDTIVGGDGNDTLTFTLSGTMGAIQVSKVETVTATGANSGNVDFASTSDITTLNIVTTAVGADAYTIDNVKSGTTVAVDDTGNTGTANVITINADSGSLALKSTTALADRMISDATSITFNTNSVNSTALWIEASALTSLTVTGSGNVAFNGSTATVALATFTGSDATGTLDLSNLDFVTTGATITTGSANATIVGGTGADTITGGGGNDTITMNVAGDVLDGGSSGTGGDTLVLAFTSLVASKVDLSATDQVVSIGATTNTVVQKNFENVNANEYQGSGIEITGSTGANVIVGSGLADVLVGNGGQDTITGGAGNDTITISDTGAAATNSATLIFSAAASNGTDTITGFKVGATTAGGDVFEISNVDSDFNASLKVATLSATGDALTSLGNAATAADVDVIILLDTTNLASAANAVTELSATGGVITDDDGALVVFWNTATSRIEVYHNSDESADGGTMTLIGVLSGSSASDIANIVAANFS